VEQENGTFVYFSSDRPGGLGAQDIYMSQQQADGSFGAAVAVDVINTTFDDARPNLRKDGLEMFFDSTRPGGQGGPDLWSTSRDSVHESWSEPVNLGPGVNSSMVDVRASLSWDGQTLFFGSNRAGGEGSQDLYFTTRTKP
jgi:hypothetical protein